MNLDNAYLSCPGLMSDGRAQPTDYRSHNRVLKEMKGNTETSYDFREKLQGTGLRDLIAGVRFNMCGEVPAGDISFSPTIKLDVVTDGSWLDSFKPFKGTMKVQTVLPIGNLENRALQENESANIVNNVQEQVPAQAVAPEAVPAQ
jgi:hypothetical protein